MDLGLRLHHRGIHREAAGCVARGGRVEFPPGRQSKIFFSVTSEILSSASGFLGGRNLFSTSTFSSDRPQPHPTAYSRAKVSFLCWGGPGAGECLECICLEDGCRSRFHHITFSPHNHPRNGICYCILLVKCVC